MAAQAIDYGAIADQVRKSKPVDYSAIAQQVRDDHKEAPETPKPSLLEIVKQGVMNSAPAQLLKGEYDAVVKPAVETAKAIADKGGPAVANDLIESTLGKLRAYAAKQNPTARDYVSAVPLVGDNVVHAYDLAKEGKYAQALGYGGATVGAMMGGEGAAKLGSNIIDAVPGAVKSTGNVVRDAAVGGTKAAIAATDIKGVPVPASILGAGSGAAAAHMVGLPSELGAAVGASIPVVKGAVSGVKEGIAARAKAAKIAAADAEYQARKANTVADLMQPPTEIAAMQPIAGQLPSGRVPGPAPQVEAPAIPQRSPLRNGIGATVPEVPQMQSAPAPLPSGRVPGSIAAQTAPSTVAEAMQATASPEILDAISQSQLGKKFSRATADQQATIKALATKALAQEAAPTSVPIPEQAPATVAQAMQQPAAPSVEVAAPEAARSLTNKFGKFVPGKQMIAGEAGTPITEAETTSGLQIPQVQSARSGVASKLAQHAFDAGISLEDLDKLAAAHKETVGTFWHEVAQLPGVSVQKSKGKPYTPSVDTIFAAREALDALEKARTTPKPKQLNPAAPATSIIQNLVTGPRMLADFMRKQ